MVSPYVIRGGLLIRKVCTISLYDGRFFYVKGGEKMADTRNIKHIKKTRGPEAVQELTGPTAKQKGSGGRRGHITVGGETISAHVYSNLPKRERKRRFDFGRPSWRHRRGGW